MHPHQEAHPSLDRTITFAGSESIVLEQEEIEFLHEQVTSLTLELRDKNNLLEEIEQELRETNKELYNALSSEAIALEEAKEIAKNLLSDEEPARESLARLLSAIYGCSVKSSDLEPTENDTIKLSPWAELDISLLSGIKSQKQFKDLSARLIAIESLVTRIKRESYALTLKSQTLRKTRQKCDN